MFVEHPVWKQYQFSDGCFHTLLQQICDSRACQRRCEQGWHCSPPASSGISGSCFDCRGVAGLCGKKDCDCWQRHQFKPTDCSLSADSKNNSVSDNTALFFPCGKIGKACKTLTLFFLLTALISASTFPAAAPLQDALFDSSINFFVHPFTTQDMATFGCKSALTSLPLACFCRG